MYNINRRKFLGLFGCSCCSLILPSCSTVPITDRRQLSIIPEYKINKQAAIAYEQFRSKAKLINDGPQLKEVKEIGKRIEVSVSAFFQNKNQEDPTKKFEWDYVLVDNDKVVNAWCMPGGKIAVYTGLLKITKNKNELKSLKELSRKAVYHHFLLFWEGCGPTQNITIRTSEHAFEWNKSPFSGLLKGRLAHQDL